MSNINTNELEEIYELLSDLSIGHASVDDVYNEVSGYITGMRSAIAERDELRELIEDARFAILTMTGQVALEKLTEV